MAKVTVLTAVYNAEPYLRKCLDSLKSQTLADCQFICIDDCSTDASVDIIKEYAAEDNRFQLLHTPVNSGQAIARNLGLQFAKGEYIAMLDADDWFERDTLEQAYHTLQETKAQCAVLQLIQHYEEDGSEVLYPIKSTKTEWSGIEAFRLSLDWSLHGLYVVEADIHKRFPFDASCRLYSDDNTTRLHYLNSAKAALCQGKYYYRKHTNSMTNACSIRRFDHLLANHAMKQQLSAMSVSDKQALLASYEQYRWFNLLALYRYYLQHKSCFTTEEHTQIRNIFSDMLSSMDASLLPLSLKLKPNYYPFTHYALFSCIQNMSFVLSKWIKR